MQQYMSGRRTVLNLEGSNFFITLASPDTTSLYSNSYFIQYVYDQLLRRNKFNTSANYYHESNDNLWRKLHELSKREFIMMLDLMQEEYVYTENSLVNVKYFNLFRLIIALSLTLLTGRLS